MPFSPPTPWAPPRQLPFFDRITDYLSYHATQIPQAEALVLNNQRLTYQQLSGRVEACAKALIAAGIKKGDRVATLSTPHPDYFVTFLATASIGAIWTGLNPKYQLDESRYVVSDAEPVLVFTRTRIGERDYCEDLQALQREFPSIQHIVVLNGDPIFEGAMDYSSFVQNGESITQNKLKHERNRVSYTDPALLVYTSGTTGKPKGALLPHRGLVRCALVQLQYLDVNPLSAINFLPINHVGCVSDLSCYLFVAGGTCVFMEKFSAEASIALIGSEKISLWFGVPTTFQISLNLKNFADYDISSLQMIAWSGGVASRPLIEKLAAITPRLCNLYGQTETVGSITFTREGDSLEIMQNTVGKPAGCYAVRIIDNAGQQVAVGEEGEIVVKGDFTMCGYLNRAQTTAETIDKDGWLHTGDLGIFREDGNIQLVGRCKEMFKSGGYNVYPLEIEQVLEAHPAIDNAVVVAVPDELYSEVGYAYLQLKAQPVCSSDEIKDYCKQRLSNYKVPKHFKIENDLPLLPIGKVDRGRLKARAKQMKRNYL